ncbi:MAG: AraC family transcriptional regulator, partial [Myxococcota bacterium]
MTQKTAKLAEGLERRVSSGSEWTKPDGLDWLTRDAPTDFETLIYTPVVCLILRGSKTTFLGDRRYVLQAGDSIIVSHDLPVRSRITEASKPQPYLSLVARLDLSELQSLEDEIRLEA